MKKNFYKKTRILLVGIALVSIICLTPNNYAKSKNTTNAINNTNITTDNTTNRTTNNTTNRTTNNTTNRTTNNTTNRTTNNTTNRTTNNTSTNETNINIITNLRNRILSRFISVINMLFRK